MTIAAVAVLSGNRNFEGRIHPRVRANFLASPPLVVAYALAGSVLIDLTREPLGEDPRGPAGLSARHLAGRRRNARSRGPDDRRRRSIASATRRSVDGPPEWRGAPAPARHDDFAWNAASTFIRRPPFFDDMKARAARRCATSAARACSRMFGDMLTTDHISPIGAISAGTPAAGYLESLGIAPRDFVNYAARRLNHDVMIRGTFAQHPRAQRDDAGRRGQLHACIYPAASGCRSTPRPQRYRDDGVPLVMVAGARIRRRLVARLGGQRARGCSACAR